MAKKDQAAKRTDGSESPPRAVVPTVHDLQNAVEWLRVTLSSIGDGVITTDAHGRVTMINPVAQQLTGWTQEAAVSRSLSEVFHIVNQETRREVENPALRALREGVIVGLANHTVLIARDGTERPIDDCAAPIRSDQGELGGAVLIFRDITERYRHEKLVKDAFEYAANILETQREPFLVLDKELRVVSGNRAFYAAFKVTKEETEGRFVYNLGNGQWNMPALRSLLEEVLPQNHAFDNFEVEHNFETIGPKVMLLNARRMQRPGNHSELILLAIEDITERRAAGQAAARLAQIVASSDDAIISKDLNGVITSWNQGAERLFGYGAAEAIGKSIMMLIPADHADEEPGILAAIRRGESIDHYETVRRRKNGSLVDISLTVSPIRDPDDGRIVGASKIARDITERKRMEQDLRDSEVRYRRLFQAAKDGILILDAHTGKITDANAFMGGLVGIEAHELVGKELHEIGLFKDTEESKRIFRELQENKYVRYENLPVQRHTGGSVEVEVVGNIYHEDHRLVAQCNVRDISQRVVMEKKIKEQAEAIASESRRKDEFLAMLSHELRNPLAPIRSAVHLLRTQERAGAENLLQKQAHEVIERQVANLTKMVSDLLEVSRVVSGRIRLDSQIVDLNHIVTHAVETVRPLIAQRRHVLTVHVCDDGVWVSADPTRLEEVFVNILNNAAKYTPDGGAIDIHCEHPRGSNYAQVRIRDTGVGIERKLLPRIFDLFTQADRSLDRAAGGLGIGLSLVHRLIELHGGTIEAHSPPEGESRGSEFIVRLGLVPVPATPPGPPASDEARGRPEGARVLVVDDNIDQAMMLATALRLSGYSVQSAYTGPDGLKVALLWRPDIVLMDIGLPGLDGYEVARRLRSDPDLRNAGVKMRIIALTGYGRNADKALAREAGFDGHLIKPVEFEELEKMLAITPAAR